MVFFWRTAESFTPQFSPLHKHLVKHPTKFRSRPLHIFGRNKDKEEKESNEDSKEDNGLKLPFFSRLVKPKKAETAENTETNPEIAENEIVGKKPEAPALAPANKEPQDPIEVAKALRAQAERVRLEAERMDAELTLKKIEKLERELVVAKSKGESVEDLQRQLDNLQAKLLGEAQKPAVVSKSSELKNAEKTFDVYSPSIDSVAGSTSLIDIEFEDVSETTQFVDNSPGFIKKLLASLVELDYDTANDLNATEIAVRLNKLQKADYSYSSLQPPSFTTAEITDAVEKIENKSKDISYPSSFVQISRGNLTKLAEYALEYEYYLNSRLGSEQEALELLTKAGEDEEFLQGMLAALNQTDVDRSIETLFPKCTRKEGQEPTMAQVQSLVANVLPSAKFTSTAKPEKVLGGYVIRGNHKYENGDDLINAIDRELAKTSLGDKMTVLYTPDFTIFARAEEDDFELDLFDPDQQPPVLYITGPDITRERQRVLLSAASAMGLATSWYLSLYPFLLNPTLAKRIEEELALADTGMTYDIAWLTDLSVPLFLTFIGIQLAHELAHRVVGSFYDVSAAGPLLLNDESVTKPLLFR